MYDAATEVTSMMRFVNYSLWVTPLLIGLGLGLQIYSQTNDLPDFVVFPWLGIMAIAGILYCLFYLTTPVVFQQKPTVWTNVKGVLSFTLGFLPLSIGFILMSAYGVRILEPGPEFWSRLLESLDPLDGRSYLFLALLVLVPPGFILALRRFWKALKTDGSVRTDLLFLLLYSAPLYSLVSMVRHYYYQANRPFGIKVIESADLYFGLSIFACAAAGYCVTAISRRIRPFPTALFASALLAVVASAIATFVLLDFQAKRHPELLYYWLAMPLGMLLEPVATLGNRRETRFGSWLLLFLFASGFSFQAFSTNRVIPIHYLSLSGFLVAGWLGYLLFRRWSEQTLSGIRRILAIGLNVFFLLALLAYELSTGWLSTIYGQSSVALLHLGSVALGILLAALYAHPELRRPNLNSLKAYAAAPVSFLIFALIGVAFVVLGGRSFKVDFDGVNRHKAGEGPQEGDYIRDAVYDYPKGPRQFLLKKTSFDGCLSGADYRSHTEMELQPYQGLNYPYSHRSSYDSVSLFGHSFPTVNIEAQDIVHLRESVEHLAGPMHTYGSGDNPLNGGPVFFVGERDQDLRILEIRFQREGSDVHLSAIRLTFYPDKNCRPAQYARNLIEPNQVFVADVLDHIDWMDNQEITAIKPVVRLRKKPDANSPVSSAAYRGMVLNTSAQYTDPGSQKIWYASSAGWASADDFVRVEDLSDLPEAAYHSYEDVEIFAFRVAELNQANMRSCKARGEPYEIPRDSVFAQFTDRRILLTGSPSAHSSDVALIDSEGIGIQAWMNNGVPDFVPIYAPPEENVRWDLDRIEEVEPRLASFLEKVLPHEYETYRNEQAAYSNLYRVKLNVRARIQYRFDCYTHPADYIEPAENVDPPVTGIVTATFFLEGFELAVDELELKPDGSMLVDGKSYRFSWKHQPAKDYCDSLDARLPESSEFEELLPELNPAEFRSGVWLESGKRATSEPPVGTRRPDEDEEGSFFDFGSDDRPAFYEATATESTKALVYCVPK